MPLFQTPPSSICILRLSAIGDCCHALALVRVIQRAWPQTRITWITGFAAVTLKAGKAVPQAKVLSKPFHLRDLVLEVERMFGSETLTGLS